MKKNLLFYPVIIITFFFLSCEDDSLTTRTVEPFVSPQKVDASVSYKMLVKGDNLLDIRLGASQIAQGKVFITSGSDTSLLASFTPQLPNYANLTASIEYDFPSQPIDLLLQIKREQNDTIYNVPLLDYQHRFVDILKEEMLFEFDNYLQEFDLSPDNGMFFYSINPSNIASVTSLYSYNIVTGEQKLIDDDFKGGLIRAINQDLIYTVSKFKDDRTLQLDSAALYTYNINSKEYDFVNYVREPGTFSRVVDEQILVSILTPRDNNIDESGSRLISVGSKEFTPIKNSAINLYSSTINSLRRDGLWFESRRVLSDASVQTFDFLETSFFSINAYDNNTGLLQGTNYELADLNGFQYAKQKITVFEGTNQIFEETEGKIKYLYTVMGQNPAKIPYVVYQEFLAEDGSNDGYYLIDTEEQEIKLIRSNGGISPIDYWIENRTFISIRHDGLYKYNLD
ncbi:MAG: hypothetical protein AAGI07_03500 [Bacteroidota bacterium]